jgi:hypothetical protein
MGNPFPLKQQLPIPSSGLVGIQPDFGIIHSGNMPRGSAMCQPIYLSTIAKTISVHLSAIVAYRQIGPGHA